MKHTKEPKTNHIFWYRAYPTLEQESAFGQYFGTVRYIWNWGLAERERVRKEMEARPKEERKYLSFFDQCKALTALKRQPETAWLRTVDSNVPLAALNALDEAYKHFFRRLKEGKRGHAAGFPKFKKKQFIVEGDIRGKQAYTTRGAIKLDLATIVRLPRPLARTMRPFTHLLRLPIVGDLRILLDRDPIGTIKRATVVKRPDGTYRVILLTQTPIAPAATIDPTTVDPKRVLGMNAGLRHLLALHTGEFIANPEFYQESIERLRFLNRRISRLERRRKSDTLGRPTEAPSKALLRARARYNKQMLLVADRRERYLHHISKRLVNDWDAIVLEQWRPSELMRTNVRALAFRIADAAWGELRRQLEYKTKKAGKLVVKLDQGDKLNVCFHCGHAFTMNYSRERVQCGNCFRVLHVDTNAARNARRLALERMGLRDEAEI